MNGLQESAELPAMERSAALMTGPPNQAAAHMVFSMVSTSLKKGPRSDVITLPADNVVSD